MGRAQPNPLVLLLGSLNVFNVSYLLRSPFIKMLDLTSKVNQSTKDFFFQQPQSGTAEWPQTLLITLYVQLQI